MASFLFTFQNCSSIGTSFSLASSSFGPGVFQAPERATVYYGMIGTSPCIRRGDHSRNTGLGFGKLRGGFTVQGSNWVLRTQKKHPAFRESDTKWGFSTWSGLFALFHSLTRTSFQFPLSIAWHASGPSSFDSVLVGTGSCWMGGTWCGEAGVSLMADASNQHSSLHLYVYGGTDEQRLLCFRGRDGTKIISFLFRSLVSCVLCLGMLRLIVCVYWGARDRVYCWHEEIRAVWERIVITRVCLRRQ